MQKLDHLCAAPQHTAGPLGDTKRSLASFVECLKNRIRHHRDKSKFTIDARILGVIDLSEKLLLFLC
jgi:hypothetical protein